jgi:predicted KAP-like P-loop ATPase
MFKNDAPIQGHKEDLLNRRPYSEFIAQSILNYKDKESLVVGLYGDWGSGKTSILNMIVENIVASTSTEEEEKRPVVIRFNPWNFSNQNQITFQFFQAIAIALNRKDRGKEAQKVGEKLKLYSKLFSPFSLIPTLGPIVKVVSELFEKVGEGALKFADYREANLEESKSELNELLDALSRKIIVIVDDVDRLANEEIRLIFQLVKSIGDFKNTVYLLSFDKRIVSNALSKVQEGNGDDYLEKIVHVPFTIPSISSDERDFVVTKIINEIFASEPEERLDGKQWNLLYRSGLNEYFRNFRDIVRYSNVLRFSYESIGKETNLVDLCGVTAIQVFSPELYKAIADKRSFFVGPFDFSLSMDRGSEKRLAPFSDDIIKLEKRLPFDTAKEFLQYLFPKLTKIYDGNKHFLEGSENWRKTFRVSHSDTFDAYFRFAVPKAGFTSDQIKEFIKSTAILTEFKAVLEKLNSQERIVSFLDRFADYIELDIPEDRFENILTALLDLGDAFPEGERHLFDIRTRQRIWTMNHQLLKRVKGKGKRLTILSNSISGAESSIRTVVDQVSIIEEIKADPRESRKDEGENILFTDVETEKLKGLAASKILNWHENGKLKDSPHLPYLLSRWKKWKPGKAYSGFISDLLRDKVALIKFLELQNHGRKGEPLPFRGPYELNIKEVTDLIDAKSLLRSLKGILKSGLVNSISEYDLGLVKYSISRLNKSTDNRSNQENEE